MPPSTCLFFTIKNRNMNNLVVNGGFDDNSLSPWETDNDASPYKINVTDLEYYGKDDPDILNPSPCYSAKIESFSSDTGKVTIQQQIFNMIVGNLYTLSFAINKFDSDLQKGYFEFGIGGGNLDNDSIQLEDLENEEWYVFNYCFVAQTDDAMLHFTTYDMSPNCVLYLDAVSITLIPPPCFSGKSLVRTKNIKTGEVADIPADQVLSSVHHVFRTDTNEFVPIIYNANTGSTLRYIKIAKDAMGENRPTEDLFITSGHTLFVDGKFIKAGQLEQGKVHKIDTAEKIYTIATHKAYPIWINGLDVMTYSKAKFLAYVEKKGFAWSDNKLQDQ